MGASESSPEQRVLVIGLSMAKNEEVVASLRGLGFDAVGCTEPDTAAERHNAHHFQVIAFGRGTLGPRTDRLKHVFAEQDPRVGFVDALGPVAVAQVVAALGRRPGSPVLVESLAFGRVDHGGRIRARVLAACHITVTLYRQPIQGALEERCLLDGDVTEGEMTCAIAAADFADAYSLVVAADGVEFHHLPFL